MKEQELRQRIAAIAQRIDSTSPCSRQRWGALGMGSILAAAAAISGCDKDQAAKSADGMVTSPSTTPTASVHDSTATKPPIDHGAMPEYMAPDDGTDVPVTTATASSGEPEPIDVGPQPEYMAHMP